MMERRRLGLGRTLTTTLDLGLFATSVAVSPQNSGVKTTPMRRPLHPQMKNLRVVLLFKNGVKLRLVDGLLKEFQNTRAPLTPFCMERRQLLRLKFTDRTLHKTQKQRKNNAYVYVKKTVWN
jgi:hypothetical protein